MAWEPQIVSTRIAGLVTAGIAIFSYWHTRDKEIKNNINLNRLDKYDKLLNALTRFVKNANNTRYPQDLIGSVLRGRCQRK